MCAPLSGSFAALASASLSNLLLSQQLIVVDELKNDYRNPMDFAKNLNRVSVALYLSAIHTLAV